jgi:hypothetical protein
MKKKSFSIPVRYLPFRLTRSDKKQQINMLNKSRKQYKQGKYYTRKQVKSFKSKPSSHIQDAQRIYGVQTIQANKELAAASGCSIPAMKKIISKGEGAYFSSGSRPNQTAQSWGVARLASALTGGKAAAVDFNIIDNGCDHKKRAYILAKKSVKKYNHGQSKTKKRLIVS